jgi:hypothetical protein
MFHLVVAKVDPTVVKVDMNVAYTRTLQSICFKYFIRMLQSGYCIYFAMAINVFSGVSDVCCKCFNCFERMLQVLHLDITKVNLSVAHVAMGPICSNHFEQLLGSPACAWVWRERHDADAGHEARMGHGVGVEQSGTDHGASTGHGATWAPHEAGAGVVTLAHSNGSGTGRSKFEHP